MTRALSTAARARWLDRAGDVSRAEAQQSQRLADLVAHARVWSPLYAELYADVPDRVTDPSVLPVVTKSQMMARFDEWVTDPLVTRRGVEAFVGDLSRVGEPYLGRYVVGTTSGTTGDPAIVVADRHMLAVSTGLALARRRRGIPTSPRLLSGLRVALLVATGGHFMGAALAESYRRRSSWFAEHYRILSVLAPIEDLVRQLNAFRPTVLAGYASVLTSLAHQAQRGALHIEPLVVSSSAETLPAADKAFIARTFGAPVREEYGSSEILYAATECAHGTMHANLDWTILEPVDANHRPVPVGTPSHTVLVTNLSNRVQPFIRYDLGDSITVLADPCACGSPRPGIRPVGRRGDVLDLPAQHGVEPIRILPLAVSTVIEETPGVVRAQLVHVPPDRLRVRLETQGPRLQVAEEVGQRLRTWLKGQGVADVVVIEHDDILPRRDEPSGKFRAVVTVPHD